VFNTAIQQHSAASVSDVIASHVSELHRLLPTVSHLCRKLASYPIKQTLVQCDFHDNNILIDDTLQTLTFIDLGEIVISHPFFSLVGCLRQAKTHHALTEGDAAYQQLRQACLNNFMHLGTDAELTEAFSVAGILWFMYEALAQYRLRNACDQARFLSFQRQGKLSGALNDFITACKQFNNPS
jgi:aminoglycoside phosphotransferase (APT) family kinase protein